VRVVDGAAVQARADLLATEEPAEIRVIDVRGEQRTIAITMRTPGRDFELALPQDPALASGSPDLVAQLLDKLVANAVDFSREGVPVLVSLSAEDGTAVLAVTNQGPLLPEVMRGKLFDSMVSVRGGRDGKSGEPHLGLGLYVARLIAEFHGGEIRAENLASGAGVAVTATFRLG